MIFTFTKMVSIHVPGCSFPYRTASIRHVIDAGAEKIPQRFGTTLTQWSHKVERFNTDIWNEMTWQQYVFNAKYPFWFPWYWILKCLKTFIPIKKHILLYLQWSKYNCPTFLWPSVWRAHSPSFIIALVGDHSSANYFKRRSSVSGEGAENFLINTV